MFQTNQHSSSENKFEKKDFSKTFAVILAGGSGTRFWPRSRMKTPKQLCHIGDASQSMLELTLQRLDAIIPPERRVIVTHHEQYEATKKIVKDKCHHIISEPSAQNTAAALTLGAFYLLKNCQADASSFMISLHADHIIEESQKFYESLAQAQKVAAFDLLTLIGVCPRHPETAYGYIEVGERKELSDKSSWFSVASFKEKPKLELAKTYLQEKRFYWNSGMFVWKIQTLLEELEAYLPHTYFSLLKWSELSQEERTCSQKLEAIYQGLSSIAIDEAVLEKSQKIAMVESMFTWIDVGSWDSLSLLNRPQDTQKNVTKGDCFLLDCQDSIVESDGPFLAAIGLKNIVVIAHGGALLVCDKNKAQDVKKVVEYLKRSERTELL